MDLIVRGSILKKMRIEAELTQSKLASMVGVSQAHIAKIEGEKVDPRLSTVNKILRVLVGGKGKKCSEIMTTGLITVKPKEKISEVSRVMVENAISQMPVIDDNLVLGIVTEEGIVSNLNSRIAEQLVENVMEPSFPIVPEETDISIVRQLLEVDLGVLVTRNGKLVGIITRSDFLKSMSSIVP